MLEVLVLLSPILIALGIPVVSEIRSAWKRRNTCFVCPYCDREHQKDEAWFDLAARDVIENGADRFSCARCNTDMTYLLVEHPMFNKALRRRNSRMNARLAAKQQNALAAEYLKELRALNSNKETERA